MKKVILLFIVLCLALACNTKHGTNEPTVDSKANPAELPVDSVGGTDMESSAADSNNTGEAGQVAGGSDLKTGSTAEGNKAISSDGNVVSGNKKDSTAKELPAKNR